MKLVGFYGHQGSGKNTCGNFIFGSTIVNLGLCESASINEKGQLVVPVVKEDGEKEDTIIDPLSPNKQAQAFFEEHIWPWCKIYSFADPLKAVCHQILGLSSEQCYGSQKDKEGLTDYKWEDMPKFRTGKREPKKEGKMTGREVLQFVGTEIFRRMNPDVWVNATLRRIQVEQPQLAIVCDVRFPNEVEGIQKLGGKVIKLLRDPYKESGKEDLHVSETVLDGKPDDYFDAIIDNTHSNIERNNEQVKEVLVGWGWGATVEE